MIRKLQFFKMNIFLAFLRFLVFSSLAVIAFYIFQVFLKAIQLILFRGYEFEVVTLYVAIHRMHFRLIEFLVELLIATIVFILTVIIIKKLNIFKFIHLFSIFL